MIRDLLKSFLIAVGGLVIIILSFSLLIRIIPFIGKLLLFVRFGMILFGFFSVLFRILKNIALKKTDKLKMCIGF